MIDSVCHTSWKKKEKQSNLKPVIEAHWNTPCLIFLSLLYSNAIDWIEWSETSPSPWKSLISSWHFEGLLDFDDAPVYPSGLSNNACAELPAAPARYLSQLSGEQSLSTKLLSKASATLKPHPVVLLIHKLFPWCGRLSAWPLGEFQLIKNPTCN